MINDPNCEIDEVDLDIDFDSDEPLNCPLNPEPGEICEACQ